MYYVNENMNLNVVGVSIILLPLLSSILLKKYFSQAS